MYNYMGKERLEQVLKSYLEKTSRDKLEMLMEAEEKSEEIDIPIYKYRRDKGSEWLKANLIRYGKEIEFKLFSAVNKKSGERVVCLNEIFSYENNNYGFSQSVYHSYAFYNKDFAPIDGAGSLELVCDTIRKTSEKR